MCVSVPIKEVWPHCQSPKKGRCGLFACQSPPPPKGGMASVSPPPKGGVASLLVSPNKRFVASVDHILKFYHPHSTVICNPGERCKCGRVLCHHSPAPVPVVELVLKSTTHTHYSRERSVTKTIINSLKCVMSQTCVLY